MNRLAATAPLALLTQSGGLDTVLVRQVDSGPTWFAVAVGIAQIVIAVTIVVAVLAALLTWLNLMRKLRHRDGTLGSILHNVKSLSRRANRVAGTVNRLADVAMENARKVDRTVDDATERVTRLFDGAERHVQALNSLVDVAREEAEDALIGSVAAVRGLRAGATRLRRPGGNDQTLDHMSDESDLDDDDLDDEDLDDDDLDDEEFDNGDSDDEESVDNEDEHDLVNAEFADGNLETENDLDDDATLLDTGERRRFERALDRFDRELLYGAYLSDEDNTHAERRQPRSPGPTDRGARFQRSTEEYAHDRPDVPGADIERPRRRPRA